MQNTSQQKIGEIIQKIKEHNLNYVQGAAQFGIKVKAIYDYNHKSKQKSLKGETLNTSQEVSEEQGTDKRIVSKADQTSEISSVRRSSLPQEVQKIILEYRKLHPEHGYKRIEDTLKSQYFLVISRKKIREVLKEHGLSKSCDSSFDRVQSGNGAKKGSRRFEADYAQELYQMDITYIYITGHPVLYLIVILDDHSRYCVGARLSYDQKSLSMIEVLQESISRYGKPCKLLTDQGSSFYTWSNEKTLFEKYLDDMEIEHIVADPHSPQTLGKIERFNQTIKNELFCKVRFNSYREACRGIADYIDSYNNHRPHQGLGGSCPGARFRGIQGERSRVESMLRSKELDLSKGYMIFKDSDHTVSIVGSSKGLQIFMDGKLLKGGAHEAKC